MRPLARADLKMRGSVILVDAANVIGSRPDGWWRDRPGAAARLVAELEDRASPAGAASAAGHHAPGCVIVVLEGQFRKGVAEREGRVSVRHAPGEGDDLLAELCAAGVVLVTADRELQARARARGADVQGPRWLLDQLGG